MDARGAEMTYAAAPNSTILKSSLMFGGNGSKLQKLVSLTKIPLSPIVQASGAFQVRCLLLFFVIFIICKEENKAGI